MNIPTDESTITGTNTISAIALVTWLLTAGMGLAQTNSSAWDWTTASPESQGMSASKLKEMTAVLAARNTSGLLVIRNDRIVWEWYAPGAGTNLPHGTASLAKALVGGVALAVGITDGCRNLLPSWTPNRRQLSPQPVELCRFHNRN